MPARRQRWISRTTVRIYGTSGTGSARSAGIGLVDLMVGLTVGLIALLVMLNVAFLFEARKKSTIGMADAQLNAAGALSLLARDLRMAGQGLGPAGALGCEATHHHGSLTLAPVTIANGLDGGPDQIRLLASAAPQSLSPATLITDHPADASTLMLDSTLGIAPGDWLLLYEPSKACTVFRATVIPTGGYRVDHVLPSASMSVGYLSGARTINLGAMHYVQYAVDEYQTLQISRYDITTGTWQSAAMASNIVSLQAQYGFDLRAGPQISPQVTRWSSTMLDADGNATTGDNGDLTRLIAIRIAFVARSAQRSDQGCNASLPQWIAANESTGALTATDIPLPQADWRCYRYRVLQTEIPLRNLLWGDS